MRFEWDERKRLLNLRDHEVDFIDMVQIFDERPTFTIIRRATTRIGGARLGS
jgi:uncharacterized DUF497 family protein